MLKKLAIATAFIAVFAYAYLAFIGVEPKDRRPGTKLAGPVAELPTELATLAAPNEVHLETYPWYGIPFSVTVVVAYDDGQLYVPSLYDEPMAFPGTKHWNHIVQDDPRVRLRSDGQLYEFNIAPVTDEAEFASAFAAFGEKYPFWREQIELDGRQPRFALLRLDPR